MHKVTATTAATLPLITRAFNLFLVLLPVPLSLTGMVWLTERHNQLNKCYSNTLHRPKASFYCVSLVIVVTILGDPGAVSRFQVRAEEPLGTLSYKTSSKRSQSFWHIIGARKSLCFSAQSERSVL